MKKPPVIFVFSRYSGFNDPPKKMVAGGVALVSKPTVDSERSGPCTVVRSPLRYTLWIPASPDAHVPHKPAPLNTSGRVSVGVLRL